MTISKWGIENEERSQELPDDLEANYNSTRMLHERPPTSPERDRERRHSGSLSRALKAPTAALTNLFSLKEPETIWTAKTPAAWDTRMLFKRRITTLYISATSLKSYTELNHSGLRKILKKWVSTLII